MKYLISFLFLALAFSMKSEAKVTLPSILVFITIEQPKLIRNIRV